MAHACRPHPYGVQPGGGMLLDAHAAMATRTLGLGAGLARLSDELLLGVLGALPARDLCTAARVSRIFYVLAHADELWRARVIECGARRGFRFVQCWKRTYAANFSPRQLPWLCKEGHTPIRVAHVYSETLFQPWLCASLDLDRSWYAPGLAPSTIDRREGLSLEQFVAEYETAGRPVVVTDMVPQWPAAGWTLSSLVDRFGDVLFEAGPVHVPLTDYARYAAAVTEERPLYIFDPKFGEKAPALAQEYSVPEYFAEDLFGLLGPSRPNYRWLIVGPARSGSSWHIDPNATSAWNAVLAGRKKWIMYPPGVVPPGVHPSADGSEVTSPVSITEWLLNFYEETKHTPVRPLECVVGPGEVIFVPSGWWHMVLNLDDTIAITQNYVSRRNLRQVLAFLRDKRDQVSGYGDDAAASETLHDRFVAAFEAAHPGELDGLLSADKDTAQGTASASLWSRLTGGVNGGGGGGDGGAPKPTTFTFSFGAS